MRHAGLYLFTDGKFRFCYQEINHVPVPVMVPVQVQNVLDEFFSVVKPETKLDVIKCQCNLSAVLL
ncbi:MAG: hypothetical protein BWY45_02404 [Euryarchaeota archaeon ADurb.Bin294]|nr:MAG: hypothetical protein BWY45_02404 [Euryarchaeota archaeon ADurb.Bin294]